MLYNISEQQVLMQDSKYERKEESYEDFAYRFQLAEGLPMDERGIIFIGNTRAGKSTLALSMTGAAMKIVYDSGNLTFVNPTDKNLQHIVKNSHTSVTQKPNFYKKSSHNKCAIVDMPGHADNSRFRELINFHYIRTMASNLKEVRFLIVVTLRYMNDKFTLAEQELDMLDSFRTSFPNCSNYVTIVINKIEDLKHNEKSARRGFRDSLATCTNAELKMFYHSITDNRICVLERPQYRISANGDSKYEEPYINMNSKTQKIMMNNEAEFIKLKESDYYMLNIFKPGDNQNNKAFLDKIDEYMHSIASLMERAYKLFVEMILQLTKSVVIEKSCELELMSLIDIFLAECSIDTPDKKAVSFAKQKSQLILNKSKLLEMLHLIIQPEYKFKNMEVSSEASRQNEHRKEQFCRRMIGDYFKKLQEVADSLFHSEQLGKRILDFYLFCQRRISECFFLSNLIVKQQNVVILNKASYSNEVVYLVEYFHNISIDHFKQYFSEIVKYFVNISIPKIFSEHKNHFAELEKELVRDFDCIIDITSILSDIEDYQKVIKPAILKRKEETTNYFIIHNQPKHEEIPSQVEKILMFYQNASIDMRLEAVHKLGKLLERQKDYKTAAILYLYLHLSEEAMRVLALLEPALKKEQAVEWFSEFAKILAENGKFSYAQRCLQSAKKHSSGQIIRYMQLQQRCLQLNDPNYISNIISKRSELRDKQSLWNWVAVSEEIAFQIRRMHVNAASSITRPILLNRYR